MGDMFMEKYEKMLLSIHNPELNCFANRGDWLYVAHKKDTKKGLFRLPNYLYYFVSLNEERLPSEFGVVKRIEHPITARELAEMDYANRKKSQEVLTDEIVEDYEKFLKVINAQPIDTPMGVTWFERVLPKKARELKVHKKFFTGLSKEEKKELFEW